MTDVFISYARADQEKVEKLADALVARGVSVWWDKQIKSGSEYSADIETALNAAGAVIVCWSKASAGSRWVKDEAGAGAEAGKLLAVSFDGERPPLGFRQFHSVNLSDWRGDPLDPAFIEFMTAVEGHLAEGGGRPPGPVVSPSAAKRSLTSMTKVIFAGAVIVAVAVIAFLGARSGPSPARVTAGATSSGDGGGLQIDESPVLEKSIAVLPFVDMSVAGDQAYFSDGVTEEILNALSSFDDLRVAGRTSSFSFKGQNADLRSIGEKLRVRHILEGSVRKQGDSVRVTAQLVQASDGFRLWSESFDGSLDDIFEFQERIARSVADKLAVLLDAESGERLARRLTESRDAYDLFLRARAMVAPRFGPDTLSNAIGLLELAVELDPTFAEAWAELARANYFLPQYMPVPNADSYLERSDDATSRALALDPGLARAYLAKAGVHSYRGEFVETYDALTKAIELDPNDADIVGAVGYYWSYLGLSERALPFLEKAAELDPINISNQFTLGVANMNAGRLEEAERLLRACVEAGYVPAGIIRPQITALRGDAVAAEQQFAAGFDMINPGLRKKFGDENAEVARVVAAALYGDDPAAQSIVRKHLNELALDPSIASNPAILGVMLQAGEYELFMRTFESGRFGGSTFVLNIIWDARDRTVGLRGHPGFADFVERAGLAEAWRTHGAPEGCREPSVGAGFECI
ncbi:MAG: TIR domain-containing protein [Alphaproteobacteria bacterium]|nr:TIR domain-containing protein [Alphaproteobacteria bacterium]